MLCTTKSNRSLGNSFEHQFCEMLADAGYWVHNMAQNSAGQPADVIAVKNSFPHLIDCKVCSKDKFPLSRVEANQQMAMNLWQTCGNGSAWFALELSDGVYMLSYDTIVQHQVYYPEVTTLNRDRILRLAIPLREWQVFYDKDNRI